MAEIRGVLRRQDFAQGHLDLYRVLQVVHQTQAVGNAYAMGVHNGGAGNVEHVAQNEIGGLAPYAGQGRQLLHGTGQLAVVFLQQDLGAGHNIPGLGVVEAAGVDILLHLFHIRLRKVPEGGEAGKKSGGDLVHPLVGALGGQTHGKKQLIVLSPVQRAVRQRVFLQQQPDNLVYLFLRSHFSASCFCLSINIASFRDFVNQNQTKGVKSTRLCLFLQKSFLAVAI